MWVHEDGRQRTLSFAEMAKETKKTANFFKSLGIGKGDTVMLILKRHYEFWFSILALHRIGAIAIPGTHMLTTKDVVYRNNAAGIKAIVCAHDSGAAGSIDESLPQSPTLKIRVMVGVQREGWVDFQSGQAAASEDFPKPQGDELACGSDPLLMFFTSGTTGMPKMVLHNHFYPLGHITTAKYWHNVVDSGLHLTVSDTGWAKAMWGKLYGQWIAGSAIMVYDYERFVPAEMVRILSRYKVDTFCAPPTALRLMIKEDLTGCDFSNLKYATVAGEPLNPEVYHRFLQITGVRLMEGYGQSETTIIAGNFLYMTPRPGSMGRRSAQYNLMVVDDDGEECESGVVGELAIKFDSPPPGLFTGYYGDESRTAEALGNGLYRTGDTAWMDEDEYFWYVGRSDDLIKSSGYRIGPFEVESALMEHPAVMETAITGVPDAVRGQIVKATIVLARGFMPSEALKKELQEHVKRTTAPFKYPRIIEFVSELPKTISGKIRRVELRERDAKS